VLRTYFTVDEKLAALETKYVSEFFGSWRERLLQGMAPGGSAYALVGLHEEQYKPDLTSDAVARYIRQHQLPDGHFQGVGCGGSQITRGTRGFSAAERAVRDHEMRATGAPGWDSKPNRDSHNGRLKYVRSGLGAGYGLWSGSSAAGRRASRCK
jgi:hypothetical protein